MANKTPVILDGSLHKPIAAGDTIDPAALPAFTETPITPVSSGAINLIVSGVANHTLEPVLSIDAITPGNVVFGISLNGLKGNVAIPAETALVATDSSTIDFTASGVAGHALTGVVKISATPGNVVLVANPDGLAASVLIPASLQKIRGVQALAAGNNIVAYGIALSSTPAMIEVRDDSTGELISHRVVAETTTTATINVTGAVTAARITVIG